MSGVVQVYRQTHDGFPMKEPVALEFRNLSAHDRHEQPDIRAARWAGDVTQYDPDLLPLDGQVYIILDHHRAPGVVYTSCRVTVIELNTMADGPDMPGHAALQFGHATRKLIRRVRVNVTYERCLSSKLWDSLHKAVAL